MKAKEILKLLEVNSPTDKQKEFAVKLEEGLRAQFVIEDTLRVLNGGYRADEMPQGFREGIIALLKSMKDYSDDISKEVDDG